MNFLPTHFHFLAPVWLWGLAALPLVLAACWWQQRDGNFARLADSVLLPHLLGGKAKRRLAPTLLAGLVWALGCVALAGPSWQQLPLPLMQSQSAQVVALSLSKTMYADDLPPSRLDRARFKVSDLLDANKAGLNALVGFAGDAFVVAPLTRDAHSLSALLAAMSPATMPVDGHNAAAAIDQSVKLLQQAGETNGLILLICADANADAVAAASRARAAGMRVSVLGIGNNDKKPVTLPDGSLLHDAKGNLVLSQREDARLAAIAQAGGGRYLVASNGKADIQTLEQDLRSKGAKQLKRQIDHWRDAGPWLLLPLLALLALLFRRGWLLVLLLLPLAYTPPAQASDWQQYWQNLWLRPDQQAARALAQGDAAKAETLAKDPDWKGSAAYQAGHYQAALDAFSHSQSPDASYNLGNAQARLGKIDEAIASYEKALKQNPDNTDAKANLELLKKLKQQQQQKQQGKDGKSGKDGKDKQQNQQGDKQKQNGQQDSSQQQGSSSSKSQDQQQQNSKQQNGQSQANQPHDSQQQSQAGKDKPPSSSAQQAEGDQPKPAQTQTERKAEQEATDKAKQALSQQLDKALDKPQQPSPATPESVNDLGQATPTDSLKQLPGNTRQLLLSVPDDPGALLKRKFEMEYQQRQSGDRP